MCHRYFFVARACLIAAAALLAGGCTVTQEGIQTFEVPIEEVLPPSRVVASYRQLNKPVPMKDAELDEQFGNAERLDILEKWSRLKTVFSDYGIPERPPKARISVTELSTKQNAYGAYSNMRPGDLNEKSYVKIGVHGTVIEDRLFFVQDRYLMVVRDLSGSHDPERRTMLINFGHAISDRLPRDITDISLVGYLPYENRVPASEKLEKEDPLGMNMFKSGGVTAAFKIKEKVDNKINERDCKVFLADAKDKSGANSALKSLRKEFDRLGKTEDIGLGEENKGDTKSFTCQINGSPGMIAKREGVVYGCYGTYNEKEMKGLMSNIDRRIKPYVPPKIKEKEKDPVDEDKKKSNMGR